MTTPPYDQQAESALVGALLVDPRAYETVSANLSPEDFYVPRIRHVYAAISELWLEGQAIDTVTVAGLLQRRNMLEAVGGSAELITLIAQAGAVANVGTYADRIAQCAGYRNLIRLCDEVREQAFDQTAPAGDLGETLAARASSTTVALSSVTPEGLTTVDEFLDRPTSDRPDWVIPGLARVGWRVMVVAAEGVGKTVLFRQIGLAAAQGLHPLHYNSITPCRTLIVDLENPDDSIHDVCEPIRQQTLQTSGDYDPQRAWLWHRPGGIDLRNRRDRGDLESVIAATRPNLVCLGPVYKCYRVGARDSDELAASEVMAVFDDLRTRYRFALMLEHHAAKGDGRSRDLMPYGSSLWLRWPEIGLKLVPNDDRNMTMTVGRWRGDRLQNAWPVELERSQPWPWRGIWPTGTLHDPAHIPVERPRYSDGYGDDDEF